MRETHVVDNELERAKDCVLTQALQRPELTPRLGSFKLHKLLGRGGNGSVYEALDARSGSIVAVKVLLEPDADSITRFKSEFRRLADLPHNNLVRLLELFREGDDWYFSMELVRGVDFKQHARPTASSMRDPDEVRAALLELLSAVQTIHAAGYLHCDLKPSNVLVEPNGRVVVLDFGLLAPAGERALPGDTWQLGTPAYMAPELLLGGAHSHSSDAYAVGVMLFEVLSGRPPSDARGVARGLAILHDLNDRVPADLLAVCKALLAHDAGARMTLNEAAARIDRRAHTTAPTLTRLAVPLVGREGELSTLLATFGELCDAPRACFVSGPSGIGKTALCDAFAERLSGRALILRGLCHERESLPYKAFDGLVDELVRELASLPAAVVCDLRPRHVPALVRVFPGLRAAFGALPAAGEHTPTNHFELLQQAIAALQELLAALARRSPLVLIVDDLQWADLDSARLLLELLGPPNAPALLYLGCYRSDERDHSDFLRALFSPDIAPPLQCETQQLGLGPLATDDAVAMARHMLPAMDVEAELPLARIARESAGIPFSIVELARYFAAELDERDSALSLTTVLSSRISALSALELEIMCTLALAGRPVSGVVIARIAHDPERSDPALRALSITGLIRCRTQGKWVVYHDRLRAHLLRLLSEAQRTALHRALAASYETAPDTEPAWLIEHWLGAGEPARARDYAFDAARAATQKLAFNRAAGLWRDVIQLCDPADARLPKLYTDLAEALANAGRSAEAAEAFQSAAERAEPAATTDLRCRAVQQFLRSGRTTQAIDLLRALLKEVGLTYPESKAAAYAGIVLSRTRLSLRRVSPCQSKAVVVSALMQRRLLVLRSVFRELSLVQPLQGAVFQSLFHECAMSTGDLETRFVALAWDTYGIGFHRGSRAHKTLAKNLVQLEGMRLQLNSAYADATLLLIRSAVALFACRDADVELPAREAGQMFRERCIGASWEASVTDFVRYMSVELTGPLSALSRDAFALHRRASEHGDLFTQAVTSRMMSLGLLALDRPAQAVVFLRDCTTRLGRVAGREFEIGELILEHSLVDCLSYQQKHVEAWETFERAWPRYTQSVGFTAQYIRCASHYRRGRLAAALCVDTRDRALVRVLRRSLDELSRLPRADARAAAYWLRAVLASHDGRLAEAGELLRLGEAACVESANIVPGATLKRHRGRIRHDAEGARLVAEADATLQNLGICSPERWANAFTAGVVSGP